MKIKSDTKLYLSELGAKGFLYPSDKFITTPKDFLVETIPYVYDSSYGVIPVKVSADIVGPDDRVSVKETSIFWVEKRKIVS